MGKRLQPAFAKPPFRLARFGSTRSGLKSWEFAKATLMFRLAKFDLQARLFFFDIAQGQFLMVSKSRSPAFRNIGTWKDFQSQNLTSHGRCESHQDRMDVAELWPYFASPFCDPLIQNLLVSYSPGTIDLDRNRFLHEEPWPKPKPNPPPPRDPQKRKDEPEPELKPFEITHFCPLRLPIGRFSYQVTLTRSLGKGKQIHWRFAQKAQTM